MRLTWLSSVLLIPSLLLAQEPTRFQQELKSLDALLQKTPSFRQQITNAKKETYLANLGALQISADTATTFDRFRGLCQLLLPIRDNHFGFYQLNSDRQFPVSNLNRDSLQRVLAQKSSQDVEGIYHYSTHYTVGLVKTAANQYTGIVLESSVPSFQPGEIAMLLFERGPNLFSAIYCHPQFRIFTYNPVEKYAHQKLVYSNFYRSFFKGVYSKQLNSTDHVNLPDSAAYFTTFALSPNTEYIRVRSFANNGVLRLQSDSLFNILKNAKPMAYTILDLRNNEGGAGGVAKKYVRWITQRAKHSQVVVLVNANTVSQGEITALKLSKNRAVRLAGETTKGMIAYGSNYGRHTPLTGKTFSFYPTDMISRGLLPYEDIGVQPAIQLQEGEDWIKQVLDYWKQNNSD